MQDPETAPDDRGGSGDPPPPRPALQIGEITYVHHRRPRADGQASGLSGPPPRAGDWRGTPTAPEGLAPPSRHWRVGSVYHPTATSSADTRRALTLPKDRPQLWLAYELAPTPRARAGSVADEGREPGIAPSSAARTHPLFYRMVSAFAGGCTHTELVLIDPVRGSHTLGIYKTERAHVERLQPRTRHRGMCQSPRMMWMRLNDAMFDLDLLSRLANDAATRGDGYSVPRTYATLLFAPVRALRLGAGSFSAPPLDTTPIPAPASQYSTDEDREGDDPDEPPPQLPDAWSATALALGAEGGSGSRSRSRSPASSEDVFEDSDVSDGDFDPQSGPGGPPSPPATRGIVAPLGAGYGMHRSTFCSMLNYELLYASMYRDPAILRRHSAFCKLPASSIKTDTLVRLCAPMSHYTVSADCLTFKPVR